jgi:hypothetical protein
VNMYTPKLLHPDFN